MNLKFQKYKDVFSQPERIRLKRKTNESDENIIVRNATNNLKSKIIANTKNTSQEHTAKNETNSGKNHVNTSWPYFRVKLSFALSLLTKRKAKTKTP